MNSFRHGPRLLASAPVGLLTGPRAFDTPQLEAQPGVSPAQALCIFRAHWKASLLIAVTVIVVAAVAIKSLPKTYTATATLIVDVNNKDPLATQDSLGNALENYVATQTELLTSPVVLLPVVDQLGMNNDPESSKGFRGTPSELREFNEKKLAESIQVEIGHGYQLLYVSASARDPERASKIANAVVTEYLAEEVRRLSDPTSERAQRYSQQLGELRAKVALIQDKITVFLHKEGLTELNAPLDSDSQGDPETQALATLEEKLLDVQNQKRVLMASQAGDATASDEVAASSQIPQLESDIQNLDAQLAQLRTTYGAQHPKVMELKSQLAQKRTTLEAEKEKFRGNVSARIAQTAELEDKYKKAVEEQRAKVMSLHEKQGEGAKLALELASAQSVYKRALDGYDQVMFSSVDHHSNVGVVSWAAPPVKASKPNKMKLMMMATLAAIGLGACGPFLYEFLLARKVRCVDDLERGFGIPVLAQFEPIVAAANAV